MTAKMNMDVNYYDVLGVDMDAKEMEIRKCYRKRALKYHPDKNPDNPKANELFLELSKALEILTDPSAKAAYDKVLKAKLAAKLRIKQLDSKRQKLRTHLEERERDALNKISTSGNVYNERSMEDILQEEIERIRREGSRLLEEEQRLLKEQLQRTFVQQPNTFDSTQYRIKIKWSGSKGDTTNGGYSEEKLLRYFKKYGEIVAFVMSKKTGRALIEFKTLDAAEMAFSYEKGSLDNPLHLEWLSEPLSNSKRTLQSQTITDLDYEDLVMRKLRQREERMRLIKEMQEEDNKE